MKTKLCMFTVIVASAVALFSQSAVSEDKPGGAPDPEMMKQMMEGMKRWIETTKPGKHHQVLESHVGTWDVTFRMWMDPSAPPMETKGVSEVKWIMGKRFVLEDYKGEMLMPDETGMQMKKVPYEGMGTLGYDVYRNMYTGTWLSNIQTNVLTMNGSMEPGSKVLRMFGEMDEPMLNVIGRTVKYVTTIKDKDTRIFECFDLHASDAYRVFEIEYKRKK